MMGDAGKIRRICQCKLGNSNENGPNFVRTCEPASGSSAQCMGSLEEKLAAKLSFGRAAGLAERDKGRSGMERPCFRALPQVPISGIGLEGFERP
jgi:hypothetical protein